WLNVPGPADNQRGAIAAFPRLALLTLEWRNAAIREADRFRTIVGGEDDDGVVGLTHVIELLEDVADIVVKLLHAGFFDAPILAARLTQHGFILRREHGRDVHARRVVPDEEGLVGLLRIVPVEEIDDLGRNLLIHRPRAIQRQRALVAARLILLRAIGGLA